MCQQRVLHGERRQQDSGYHAENRFRRGGKQRVPPEHESEDQPDHAPGRRDEAESDPDLPKNCVHVRLPLFDTTFTRPG